MKSRMLKLSKRLLGCIIHITSIYIYEWGDDIFDKVFKKLHTLARHEFPEWFMWKSRKRTLDELGVDDTNPFYRPASTWNGRKSFAHPCLPMDNAGGQRIIDICVLIRGVKNRYGQSMTPNKFLWGNLFDLYTGPVAKQRNLIIIERIRDLRPDLIGTIGDDKLLREFDKSTLATLQANGAMACSDYAAPAILTTTTGGSQGFVRKEHVTVPITEEAKEFASYFCHLAPARDRYNRLCVESYVDFPMASPRNHIQFRLGGWIDGRFGQQRPSSMTIDQINEEHLEIIHAKEGVPRCICTFCQTGVPVPTPEEILSNCQDEAEIVLQLNFVRMHYAYIQAAADVDMRLTTTGT